MKGAETARCMRHPCGVCERVVALVLEDPSDHGFYSRTWGGALLIRVRSRSQVMSLWRKQSSRSKDHRR